MVHTMVSRLIQVQSSESSCACLVLAGFFEASGQTSSIQSLVQPRGQSCRSAEPKMPEVVSQRWIEATVDEPLE